MDDLGALDYRQKGSREPPWRAGGGETLELMAGAGGMISMCSMPSQQVICDAWMDMMSWASSELPSAVLNQPLSALDYEGQIEVCNLLNPPAVGQRHTMWEQGGSGQLSVTNLEITALDGTKVALARFPDPNQVQLPVSFARLAVAGKYAYRQPCQNWDLDTNKKIGSPDDSKGTGSISQQASGGELIYIAQISDSSTQPLTLQSVSITGAANVHVSEDSSGPAWLNAITAFFGGHLGLNPILEAVPSLFTAAPFTQAMLAALNAKLTT